jgi:hypothetical protein
LLKEGNGEHFRYQMTSIIDNLNMLFSGKAKSSPQKNAHTTGLICTADGPLSSCHFKVWLPMDPEVQPDIPISHLGCNDPVSSFLTKRVFYVPKRYDQLF